jgi:hypothetical protein
MISRILVGIERQNIQVSTGQKISGMIIRTCV